MGAADSSAVFCITNGLCLDWGRIIFGVISFILGAFFKHFLEMWRQKKKMKMEDEQKYKWLRNDFFEKARQPFYNFLNKMQNAYIIANMPNQNNNIENELNAYAEYHGVVSPCPFYIKDSERSKLFEYADLMSDYMYNLKLISYYRGELDKFQQWESANQDVIPVHSPQYQHASYNNQLNINAFDNVSRKAETIKQKLVSISSDANSVINTKII